MPAGRIGAQNDLPLALQQFHHARPIRRLHDAVKDTTFTIDRRPAELRHFNFSGARPWPPEA